MRGTQCSQIRFEHDRVQFVGGGFKPALLPVLLGAVLAACGGEEGGGSSGLPDVGGGGEDATVDTELGPGDTDDAGGGDTGGDAGCPGAIGCSCETVDECSDGLSCQDGSCVTCADGLVGCDCAEDGSACEPDHYCDPDDEICLTCEDGKPGCDCRPDDHEDGACDEGFTCDDDVCVDADCTPGELDCPCGIGGECGEGLFCGDDELCRSCIAGTAGCPCDAGACDSGLICDDDSDSCRSPLTCATAGCETNQACQESSGGNDAECLEECTGGLEWNGTQCVGSCDTAIAGSVGTVCAGLHQTCEENAGAGSAQCTGECVSGYVLDDGACRERVECADLSCTDPLRECVDDDPTIDASCNCVAGRVDDDGTCREKETCADLDCDGENRACTAGGPNADDTCGLCLDGYIDVGGDCVETCESLECEESGRPCIETPSPHCDEESCLAGWLPDDLGNCVDVITCSELDCDDNPCVEGDGQAQTDAYCQVEGNCPATQAELQPAGSGNCIGCPQCDGVGNEAEGLACAPGVPCHKPLASLQNQCICLADSSHFVSVQVGHPVLPCDADGDGFVRRPFFESVNSSDPQIREEATCTLRHVDRFLLVPDERPARPLRIDVGDLNVASGLSSDGGGRQFLTLYEPEALDDADILADAHETGGTAGHPQLNHYGQVPSVTGRDFRPDELNPLTRACNHRQDDYNWNFVPDATEWHGSAVPAPSASVPDVSWMEPYLRMAYFLELNRGVYVPPGGGTALLGEGCQAAHWNDDDEVYETLPCVGTPYGTYVILEKDRSADAPAVMALEIAGGVVEPASTAATYGIDDDAADAEYWRECRRSRRADYDASIPPDPIGGLTAGHRNLDFGAWSCPDEAGACLAPDSRLPSGDLSVVYDGRTPVGPRVQGDDSLVTWAGMNHHSQFVCMQLLDDNLAGFVDPTWQLDPDRAQTTTTVGAGGANRPYQVYNCGLPLLAEGLQTDPPPDGSTVNPRDPVMTCVFDSTPRPSISNRDFLQWAMVRYEPDYGRDFDGRSGYEQGCVDETVEWPFLCFGYDSDPFLNRANPSTDNDNFGHIMCGCGADNGGPACDYGCPTNRDQGIIATHASADYDPVTREGYWMCGEFSLTSYTELDDEYGPALVGTDGGGDDWVLRGQVEVTPVLRTPLCENEGCATGLRLR